MKTRQSVGMLAEWCMKHKKGNAFKDDTLENIICGIQEDLKNGNILWVIDEDGQFIGVVSFRKDEENRILLIRNLVITRHAALTVFVRYFNMRFGEGWAIHAVRKDEYVEYNTHRLCNLLLTINPKGNI